MTRRLWRNFDWLLLASAILLMVFGIAMISSATRGTEDLADYWQRQALFAASGTILLMLVAVFDYRFYETLHRPLYALTIVLLSVVFVVGEITQGVQRWIGTRAIQPSEIAKIVVIIGLAKLLADHDGDMGRPRHLLLSLGYVLLPMALIYLQPDLSTALMLGFIWLAMVLMAGVRLLHLGILTVAGAIASPLVWITLQDYMRERILLFIDPQGNPDDYYNVQQALISIGSGGWLGKGFGNGTQSQLHFLRVRHTDFIFSVIGEELGLLGAIVLFGLFTILLWRILRVAAIAQDPFGRLICTGVSILVFLQTTVNIGVNLGLLPVTGLPLPFVSYGGSSLWTFLIALGLVESVAMRHKKLDFE
ncbi:MAG: FtsW/RodA/SpoVE family cell cycle protein [Anaerolineae bacterium]